MWGIHLAMSFIPTLKAETSKSSMDVQKNYSLSIVWLNELKILVVSWVQLISELVRKANRLWLRNEVVQTHNQDNYSWWGSVTVCNIYMSDLDIEWTKEALNAANIMFH